MKLLKTRWWRARCSRAHLLFVALLLAIYLATLIFFHVELEDTSAPRETPDHVLASKKTLLSVNYPRLLADRRKHVWNKSTHVQSSTLERCADVATIQTTKNSGAHDGSWPRVSSRRPINVAAPTLPWCPERDPATPVAVNGSSSFRRLTDSHYVYSAYYDDREPTATGWGVVRVIAVLKAESATPRTPTPMLFCHVDMLSNDWSIASVLMMIMWTSRYYTTPLRYYEMCENHGKDYGGWILTCPLPRGIRRPPCRILLSSSETVDPSSAVSLPVFSTKPPAGSDSLPVRFGVCVPPLFGRVKLRTAIEFIEMTRLLGAKHFVFYAPGFTTNHDDRRSSHDVNVGDVLRLYADSGLVTVIPWTLPPATTSSSSGIWYGGQLPAINDCLYRTMHAFDRVVFNDIDEFVVARTPLNDWSAMAARFDQYFRSISTSGQVERMSMPPPSKNSGRRSQRRYCAFAFRSAFFDPMTPPSVAYVGGGSVQLMTSLLNSVAYELESDIRTEIFSAVRTKVMVDPRRVFELGIHHVSRSSGDGDCPVLQVDPRDAYVRHYRQCVRDFDAQMDCNHQCLDDELASSSRIALVRRRTRATIDSLLKRRRINR